jgi:hypothetical protein
MTENQGTWIFRFTMFIVPALLFLNGFRLYWRRRA